MIKVSVDEDTLKLIVDGNKTESLDETAIYKIRFNYITHPENQERTEQNIIETETLLVVYVDNEVSEIDIEESWAEFYYKNLKNSRFKMDPPSLELIDESSLTPQ